jgi:aarF domain-containing kinase
MAKYSTDFAAIALSVQKIFKNNTLNHKFLLSKLLSAEPKKSLKPSAIPVSRMSRIYQFSKLSVEIGSEFALKRSLSDRSVQKIVDALTKMRGAALKLGQMLSIQDSVSPQIAEILKKVQDAADYMPVEQLDEILNENFKDLSFTFDTFDKTPFAAASIGQVHRATLIDGTPVAVKVQYPGIRDSIDSDLNNLVMILNLGSMLPKGLYLENTIRVARLELARECDYILEAQNMIRFDKHLQESKLDLKRYFKVPKVFKDLSNENILVTEFVEGVSIDRARVLSQETRDQLGDRLLKLCLSELMEFRFMQTDPNFGNFLYDVEKDMVIS